jgi:hypothetical protein
MATLNQLVLAVVSAAGGGAAIGYWLFKTTAEKWLESKFDKELQQLVHTQTIEIEKLKLNLTKDFDWASKLHQHEFEVLPKIWALVSGAFWSTWAFVSPIQTYPDFSRMKPGEIDEFLDNCDLQEWEVRELRSRDDKSDFYRERIFWARAARLDEKLREANISFSQQGIFVHADIKQQIDDLLELLWLVYQEERSNEQLKTHPNSRPNTQRFRKEGEKLREDLEDEIQRRLWSPQVLDAGRGS